MRLKRNLTKKILAFFSILLLFPAANWAQKLKPVTIQGTAEFAVGKEIRLIAYDDLLSYRQKVVATDKISRDGSFKLTFSTKQIQLVQIAIQTSKAEFYIEPEETYIFTIEMDPQLFQRLDPMEYGGYLQVKSKNADQNNLNYKINNFEWKTASIVDYFAPNIISDMGNNEFDSITKNIKDRFPLEYAPTNFFKSYIYYYYANLEGVILHKSPDSLYKKYLDNEYVLYDNPSYMSFFNAFYRNYLLTSKHIGKQLLTESINQGANYLALFNAVGKDPFLINERIRELAIIQNLAELCENKEFNRKNIINLLKEIAQTSHFEEHRTIANNMLYKVNLLQSGSVLPKAQFKEIGGSSFQFSDLKGKWVYVQFFNMDCPDCIREMMVIKQLKEKYGENIEFVSLSLDFTISHLLQFKEKYPQFDWHFVHFNDQFNWIDEMGINSLPDNLLINPDGTLSNRNAPDITRDLSRFLMRQFAPEEEEINPLDPHNQK